jgi:hypothetical protein
MRKITVILSGAQWGSGLMLLLNPKDQTKQGWFHKDLVKDGEALLSRYSKGRKTLEVEVKEEVAEDLGL